MAIKLIVALDFNRDYEAMTLVDQLDPARCAIKVGHEMFTLFGPHFVRSLVDRQFKVFLDLKLYDIPNTVARSCQASAELGVWMMNVHASGGLSMMQVARRALEAYGPNRPLLIAVTVLTSMSASDVSLSGAHESIEHRISELAQLALVAGLDGVVSSALDVPTIKAACGPSFLTVTPGIRCFSDAQDDQSRIATPEHAIQAGSDYLVIGRPITRAAHPKEVVSELLSMIDGYFLGHS
jgi:orotidine-5'-phosphate decarboxylase